MLGFKDTRLYYAISMNGKILGIVAAVLVVLGGWYVFQGTPAQAPVATTPTPATTTPTTATAPSVTITYTNQGFSPESVTVPSGATVTFVNQSSNKMWVASDPHPTHQGYDGTTRSQHCAAGYTGPAPFDQCSAGDSFSFTFIKIGTWGYHNHGAPSNKGSITVTPPTPI